MRSLKGTLFRGVILGTAFILLFAGTVLYLSVTRQLLNQIDESLTDKVRILALSIEEKPYGLEVDLEEMGTEEMEESETPEYMIIRSTDGRIIYSSAIFTGLNLPVIADPSPEPLHGWHIIKGAGKVRSVVYAFLPEVDEEEDSGPTVTSIPGLVVSKEVEPGDRIVIQLFRNASGYLGFRRTFLLMLLVTGLGSIGILSLVVWVTIRKGAEPINSLATFIENSKDDNFTGRIDENTVLKELRPVVRKFNLFLGRLEGSFNRERAFTSDAAHELRTPLAGLKTTIEVTLSKERKDGEYRRTLERAIGIVRQLEHLTDSLLALARLDSGQDVPVQSRVHLQSLVSEAWENHELKAARKDLLVSLKIEKPVIAAADRNLLISVLNELFGNAVHYTQRGGSITVDMDQGAGNASLSISNTGSRVKAVDYDRVFDRFWRGNQCHDDTGTRFGLGLSIVRKIIEMMAGRIEIETELGGEFRVTVILPDQEEGQVSE